MLFEAKVSDLVLFWTRKSHALLYLYCVHKLSSFTYFFSRPRNQRYTSAGYEVHAVTLGAEFVNNIFLEIYHRFQFAYDKNIIRWSYDRIVCSIGEKNLNSLIVLKSTITENYAKSYWPLLLLLLFLLLSLLCVAINMTQKNIYLLNRQER